MTNVIQLKSAMKKENELGRILAELQAELDNKQDIIIHPQDLRMQKTGALLSRPEKMLGVQHFATDWCLGQLGQRIGIPVKYMRKCQKKPHLLAQNVNEWISELEEDTTPWMLRVKNSRMENGMGLVRGIMTERYSPFDDHEILEILHQFFGEEQANVEVKWWHRDDTGFHLRIIFDDLTTTIGTTPDGQPDVHKVGIHIENSEVGKKSIKITPLVWRLVCSNGLMGWGVNKDLEIFQQRHIYLKHHEMYGRVAEAIGNAIKAGDEAIEKLVHAKEVPVLNPLDVIKNLSEKNKYSKEFTEKVQGAFLEEEGNSAFYVVQAFTRACRESSADVRVAVEQDASKILDQLIKGA